MSQIPVSQVQVLNDKLMKEIVTADFNRRLRGEKVKAIGEAVEQGLIMPPIIVYKADGKLHIIDGQHRYAARLKKEFPLSVVILDIPKKQAIRNFLAMNSEGARVPLSHRLKVDPREMATFVRAMCQKYTARIGSVYNLMKGLKVKYGASVVNATFSKDEYALAEKILDQWSNDPRWTDRKETYWKPPIMQTVGRLCAEKKETGGSVDVLIKRLKGFDYRIGGEISKMAAAGFASQKMLANYLYKSIAATI